MYVQVAKSDVGNAGVYVNAIVSRIVIPINLKTLELEILFRTRKIYSVAARWCHYSCAANASSDNFSRACPRRPGGNTATGDALRVGTRTDHESIPCRETA